MTLVDRLNSLDRHERKFLSRRVCWLCEVKLSDGACLAMGPKCDSETMVRRIDACLETCKPRKGRRR